LDQDQNHDPDPYPLDRGTDPRENVTDPEHCCKVKVDSGVSYSIFLLLTMPVFIFYEDIFTKSQGFT
jgi:hypothetical protein